MDEPLRGCRDVDEYIQGFPEEKRDVLRKVREVVLGAAPGAVERISYGMPTYTMNGTLVHFAAFKNHLGLYPAPSGVTAFEGELSRYRHAKGSIRFPFAEEIPYDLIRRIVLYKVAALSSHVKPAP
ncbi:MAG: DUF1801 domain-containing protein [Spirochaetes bacterium]|nr:DUF1801 domain-containing protein [Spirochaetota bacterium]MBU1079863.1 DUF1801 domain-containing protein [Spirochaetota bacterium]